MVCQMVVWIAQGYLFTYVRKYWPVRYQCLPMHPGTSAAISLPGGGELHRTLP
jgi:hypothetical protein